MAGLRAAFEDARSGKGMSKRAPREYADVLKGKAPKR
jgi:hypothetical protein